MLHVSCVPEIAHGCTTDISKYQETKGLKFRNSHIMCQLARWVNGMSSQQGLNALFKHLQFSPDKNLIQINHFWYRALRLSEWAKIQTVKLLKDYLVNKSTTVLIKIDFFLKNAVFIILNKTILHCKALYDYFKNFTF